jgi:hypothetical protein
VTVPKAQIAKRSTERLSIMPENLPDTVTDAGVRDVTAYVMQPVK